MDRYDAARRRQARPGRSALGYWVPLVLTVTIATAGLAAWIWSERQQDDENDDDDDEQRRNDKDHEYDYDHDRDQSPPSPSASFGAPARAYPPPESRGAETQQGFFARVTGRTPSPQQLFDNAGQRIAAGVAAAGAAVGLSGTARSGDREAAFSDHERWNEEAESKRSRMASSQAMSKKARKTVAVVVSAEELDDEHLHDQGSAYRTEHASILSHLSNRFDPTTTRLFILIYAPTLTALPPITSAGTAPSSSSDSSSPVLIPTSPTSTSPSLFNTLHTQSLPLVDHPTMILPFQTPTGHIHILRHLSPKYVYLSDTPSLSGPNGDTVAQLKGWVGQTILVVGDEGHGGLADTETETEDEGKSAVHGQRRWWEGSSMIGLGKDIEVVDADRVGDDWVRRLAE